MPSKCAQLKEKICNVGDMFQSITDLKPNYRLSTATIYVNVYLSLVEGLSNEIRREPNSIFKLYKMLKSYIRH